MHAGRHTGRLAGEGNSKYRTIEINEYMLVYILVSGRLMFNHLICFVVSGCRYKHGLYSLQNYAKDFHIMELKVSIFGHIEFT